MDDKIIATFCLCDDLLQAMHPQENCPCQMNDADIMTTACIASLCLRGNQESARAMLTQHGYIPYMVLTTIQRWGELFEPTSESVGGTREQEASDSVRVNLDEAAIQLIDRITTTLTELQSKLQKPTGSL
jgi:hypothetical protein